LAYPLYFWKSAKWLQGLRLQTEGAEASNVDLTCTPTSSVLSRRRLPSRIEIVSGQSDSPQLVTVSLDRVDL
jgi:hypothetical protein